MPQHIAFLRAINVGGHVVKMEVLRALFTELGFKNVRTFIASGNVVFDSPAKAALLERHIEQHLKQALGYEVDTFIRSLDELRQVEADVAAKFSGDSPVYVGFLRALPAAAQQQATIALSNGVDDFSFGVRELYWLAHQGMGQSTVTGPRLAKALGASATARSITSLRKLMATFK